MSKYTCNVDLKNTWISEFINKVAIKFRFGQTFLKLSESEFYGDFIYKFRKIDGKTVFLRAV